MNHSNERWWRLIQKKSTWNNYSHYKIEETNLISVIMSVYHFLNLVKSLSADFSHKDENIEIVLYIKNNNMIWFQSLSVKITEKSDLKLLRYTESKGRHVKAICTDSIAVTKIACMSSALSLQQTIQVIDINPIYMTALPFLTASETVCPHPSTYAHNSGTCSWPPCISYEYFVVLTRMALLRCLHR